MGSIEEKLTHLLGTKAAIRQAIREKGVEVKDTDTFRSYAERIRAIVQTGTLDAPLSNVNFYDCDGKRLYSYTKEEFQALEELPPLPARNLLDCQEWNYTLEAAKELSQIRDVVEIGATYITSAGDTKIVVQIPKNDYQVRLNLNVNITNGVNIDWGDGSAFSTNTEKTGNLYWTHTYASLGTYIISITVDENCAIKLGHDSFSNSSGTTNYPLVGSYNSTAGYDYSRKNENIIKHLHIGKRVAAADIGMLFEKTTVETCTIPTSTKFVDVKSFHSCSSLLSIIIPKDVQSIGAEAFYYCHALKRACIPEKVTSLGEYAFHNCHSLENICLPNTITSIGSYAFSYCKSLASIAFPLQISTIPENICNNCNSLQEVKLSPNTKTIGSYAFQYCPSLTTIDLNEGLTKINANAFYATSLKKVELPSTLTSIGTSAFTTCPSLQLVDFRKALSIPTLSSSTIFSNNTSLKIVVPDSLYDEWITATNWTSYSSKIIKASDYETQTTEE